MVAVAGRFPRPTLDRAVARIVRRHASKFSNGNPAQAALVKEPDRDAAGLKLQRQLSKIGGNVRLIFYSSLLGTRAQPDGGTRLLIWKVSRLGRAGLTALPELVLTPPELRVCTRTRP